MPGLKTWPPLGTGLAAAWTALRRRAGGSSEFDLLARTFVARFFDSEIAGGRTDLKTAFFVMLAFLAMPGFAMSFLTAPRWDIIALMHGSEGLQIASRGDKAFYLGFAMISTGAITAVVWNSLLLDRLDSLVLGSLPVRGRTIVLAKLTALAIYLTIITIVSHTCASIAFGFGLAARNSMGFAAAGMIAHFIASACSTLFVFLSITAIQGVFFALLGGRIFLRVSPWLQAGLVTFLFLGFLLLPVIGLAVVHTLKGDGAHYAPWILNTPPLWFLGIYESILDVHDPSLLHLRNRALLGLAVAGGVTLITYPLAYRRQVSVVVETAGHRTRSSALRILGEFTTRVSSLRPQTRAATQFFFNSVFRVGRHRFVLAMTAGIVVAFSVPALMGWLPDDTKTPAVIAVSVLALPLQTITILLLGLRIAIALPADVKARWVVPVIDTPSRWLQTGIRRTLLLTAVLPPAVISSLAFWPTAGARFALLQGVVCLAFGVAFIEAILWNFEGLPCDRPWRPSQSGLKKWWPAYLALFLFVCAGLPTLEQWCLAEPLNLITIAGVFAVAALILRFTSRRRTIIPVGDDEEPDAVQLLNLN